MAEDDMLESRYLSRPRGEGTGWVLRLETPKELIGRESAKTGRAYRKNIRQLAALPLSTQRQSYVPPPIYILRNGANLVGRAIGFQGPLLTVRRATGGQQTLRVSDVKEVVIRDSRGGSLAGEFIDWPDGIFELRVDNHLIPKPRSFGSLLHAFQWSN